MANYLNKIALKGKAIKTAGILNLGSAKPAAADISKDDISIEPKNQIKYYKINIEDETADMINMKYDYDDETLEFHKLSAFSDYDEANECLSID